MTVGICLTSTPLHFMNALITHWLAIGHQLGSHYQVSIISFHYQLTSSAGCLTLVRGRNPTGFFRHCPEQASAV